MLNSFLVVPIILEEIGLKVKEINEEQNNKKIIFCEGQIFNNPYIQVLWKRSLIGVEGNAVIVQPAFIEEINSIIDKENFSVKSVMEVTKLKEKRRIKKTVKVGNIREGKDVEIKNIFEFDKFVISNKENKEPFLNPEKNLNYAQQIIQKKPFDFILNLRNFPNTVTVFPDKINKGLIGGFSIEIENKSIKEIKFYTNILSLIFNDKESEPDFNIEFIKRRKKTSFFEGIVEVVKNPVQTLTNAVSQEVKNKSGIIVLEFNEQSRFRANLAILATYLNTTIEKEKVLNEFKSIIEEQIRILLNREKAQTEIGVDYNTEATNSIIISNINKSSQYFYNDLIYILNNLKEIKVCKFKINNENNSIILYLNIFNIEHFKKLIPTYYKVIEDFNKRKQEILNFLEEKEVEETFENEVKVKYFSPWIEIDDTKINQKALKILKEQKLIEYPAHGGIRISYDKLNDFDIETAKKIFSLNKLVKRFFIEWLEENNIVPLKKYNFDNVIICKLNDPNTQKNILNEISYYKFANNSKQEVLDIRFFEENNNTFCSIKIINPNAVSLLKFKTVDNNFFHQFIKDTEKLSEEETIGSRIESFLITSNQHRDLIFALSRKYIGYNVKELSPNMKKAIELELQLRKEEKKAYSKGFYKIIRKITKSMTAKNLYTQGELRALVSKLNIFLEQTEYLSIRTYDLIMYLKIYLLNRILPFVKDGIQISQVHKGKKDESLNLLISNSGKINTYKPNLNQFNEAPSPESLNNWKEIMKGIEVVDIEIEIPVEMIEQYDISNDIEIMSNPNQVFCEARTMLDKIRQGIKERGEAKCQNAKEIP
ncbi:MAG: hypothetical protein J0H68_06695 [Sphingobacteriia bacterium]|nr:hypothetical protein [Sphingobacteriia bacterium]